MPRRVSRRSRERFQLVFSGGVYVGKNSLRGARVEDGEAVEARSVAHAVGRAVLCPTASRQIGKRAKRARFAASRLAAIIAHLRKICQSERISDASYPHISQVHGKFIFRSSHRAFFGEAKNV